MSRPDRRFWRRARSGWTDIRPLFDPAEIHRAVILDIEHAKSSVDLETYIFEADHVGHAYLEAMTAAVKRGVKVRFLFDGIGSWAIAERLVEDLKARGIHVRIFRPFGRYATLALKAFLVFNLRGLFREAPIMNRRDHRKLCLIDRRVAWVGSANISERHLNWRETAIRVKGPEMTFVRAGFEIVWSIARKTYAGYDGRMQLLRLKMYQNPLALSSARVKNKVGWTSWWSGNRYRETLLGRATKRIWIVTPYFIPTTRILRKILIAAKRGVDVRILVPQTSDWKITDWVAKTHYRVLFRSGVRIFEFQKRMMHAKCTYVDESVMVGSSNYNHRSLLHDFELDLVIDSEATVRLLDEQWAIDVSQAKEVTAEDLRKLPWPVKIIGRAFLVFRSFM